MKQLIFHFDHHHSSNTLSSYDLFIKMTCTFEKFVSQKCFVLIASNSDDDVIPRIHFETDYDHDVGLTTPEQQIACRSIKFEEDGVTYTSLPIVFDLTCRISQEDCHLTTEDDEDNEQPITSCWLQPCPDDISGVEWARMLRRISSIISNTGEKVDLSKLFRYSEKIGNVQLQIGKHVLVSGFENYCESSIRFSADYPPA